MKGFLQLENGAIFEGNIFGDTSKEVVSEVIFNTSMAGYQEILTDPSYQGQIITMTYPLIGNYGINFDYEQSKFCASKGFIVKEICQFPNNFNNEMSLNDYLKNNGVVGLSNIDTRSLTKLIRKEGSMKGLISSKKLDEKELKEKLDAFSNKDAVKNVSTKEAYELLPLKQELHIGVLDLGVKANILEMFVKRNVKLTVLPYNTTKDEILDLKLDALFLSNGPGDPKDVKEAVETTKGLIGKLPILGICLGQQIIALALGGDTKKLKFGHRGGNHPVKNLKSDKVFITSQNHGYVVTQLPKEIEITYINMNDNSIEGLEDKKNKIFSVQFHPEASPGPEDSEHIFDEFLKVIK